MSNTDIWTIHIEESAVPPITIDDTANATIVAVESEPTIVVTSDVGSSVVIVHDIGPQGPPGNNKADLALYAQALLGNAEIIVAYTPSANQTISNSGSFAGVPLTNTPAANAYINLSINGTVIGNINFLAGYTVGTMNFPTFTLHEGDLFEVIAQSPADLNFGNLRITLAGTR